MAYNIETLVKRDQFAINLLQSYINYGRSRHDNPFPPMAESEFLTSVGIQYETNLYKEMPVEKAVWQTVIDLSIEHSQTIGGTIFPPGAIHGGFSTTFARETMQDYLFRYYPGPATEAEISLWNSVVELHPHSDAADWLTANVTRIHPVPDYGFTYYGYT